jgi:glycosyltransferase involved in cell wall biosynthesis
MAKSLVAIDFRPIDRTSPRGGQFRYAVDLIRGLADLSPAGVHFLVVGSLPEPLEDLRGVCSAPHWRYRGLAPLTGSGSNYRELARTAWLLAREKVDLIHALFSPFPALAPCPATVTIYDLMFELFPEYAEALASRPYRIDRWAVRHRVRRAVAISATTAADLNRLWGVERERIDVVPLGSPFVSGAIADSADRDGRARFGELCAGVTLLSPYNLEPRKNLAALLKAVSMVISRYPGLRLLLFGRAAITAEREEQFERLIAELDVKDAVHRLGVVSDEDLAWRYGHTTLFVFPSLYEGFGLPVLEAMAAGACVVARSASAMAEIVGEAGALVETADSAVLAEAISTLLEAPARRAELAATARERSRTFTVEQMARLTLASYCFTLGTAGGPRKPLYSGA